jgi:hypothetical protein
MKRTETAKRAAFAALFAATSAMAVADPVYLECTDTVAGNNRTTNHKITLDEDAQTVVFTDNRSLAGRSIKAPAQFTQETVLFKYVSDVPGIPTVQYTINRVTLEFSVVASVKHPGLGTCKISKPVERAF